MNSRILTGLILEDNQDAQLYLQDVLEDSFAGIKINVVSLIEDAIKLLDSFQPDIALVDLNLPDGSGVELLAQLAKKSPNCIAVVTTIYDDDGHLFSALRAGAQGYLLKEQRREVLIESLQGILQNKPALTPKIALKILNYFSPSEMEKIDSSQGDDEGEVLLSKREKQVFKDDCTGFLS